MDAEKKKRGRPRKQKFFENSGMSYEGAINYALDKEVQADLDKNLADKDESQLTDDERKYLKRKKEKKSYTLNVRFTESEMQDILSKCEQYGYKTKRNISVTAFVQGLISLLTVPKLPNAIA